MSVGANGEAVPGPRVSGGEPRGEGDKGRNRRSRRKDQLGGAAEDRGEARLLAGGGVFLDDAALHRLVDSGIRRGEKFFSRRGVLAGERFRDPFRRGAQRVPAAHIENALPCRNANRFLRRTGDGHYPPNLLDARRNRKGARIGL